MRCAEHNQEFKGPNTRGNLWHFNGKGADGESIFCNIKATEQTNSDIAQDRPKEHNTMLICNAMNNAVAICNVDATRKLEVVFNEVLELLESKT